MSKKKISTGGLVYSTNPETLYEVESKRLTLEEEPSTLSPDKQLLKVTLDSKQRAGKVVTLISGFIGKSEDLELLGKTIKTKCGTGGSVKENQILVQGDYKIKVVQLLQQLHYKVKS